MRIGGAALFASGVLVGAAAVVTAMMWLPEHPPYRPVAWPGGMAAEAAPTPIPEPFGESVAPPVSVQPLAAQPTAPVPDHDTEPFPTADGPDGVADVKTTIPPPPAPSPAPPTTRPEPPKSRQVASQTRPPDPPQARRHARLVIHHGGGPGDEEAAQRIARYLQSYGFPRATLRTSRNRTDLPGVRYYHGQDEAAAQRLAQVMDWYVAEARRFRARSAKPLGDEMAPGLLELWLPDQ
ncbi:MAG TPA: hypothetical protein VEY95_09395 [Azospirillaceae bacterium]|nr:hypothetical protein [Azospirillaceae bacterium]